MHEPRTNVGDLSVFQSFMNYDTLFDAIVHNPVTDIEAKLFVHLLSFTKIVDDLIIKEYINPIMIPRITIPDLREPIVDQIFTQEQMFKEPNLIIDHLMFPEETYIDLYLDAYEDEEKEKILLERVVDGSCPEEYQMMFLEFLSRFKKSSERLNGGCLIKSIESFENKHFDVVEFLPITVLRNDGSTSYPQDIFVPDGFSIIIDLAEIIKKQQGVQNQSNEQSKTFVDQSEGVIEQSEAIVKQSEIVVEKSQKNIGKIRVVSTRDRPCTCADGVEATASTAVQLDGDEVIVRLSVQPVLGGGPEVFPQVDLAPSHPVVRDAISQSELMANMMLAMDEAMAKQQEFLLKVIEDRDVSHRRIEAIMEKAVAVAEKRKWESSSVPPKRTRLFFGNRSFNGYQGARWCRRCRTKHHGTGAREENCLKLKSGSASEKRENPSRVLGREFQMTADEAKASTDVVSGTFLINSVPARVLFYTGASFTFISELFRQKIAMPTTSLEDALVVEIADGSEVLKKCILGIEGRDFPIDLLPMLIGGFDVVVDMDWLANNHVEFRKGDVAIISMTKTRKYLVKGCSSFLAYVIDAKLEKLKLEDVKIVHEFPDVFPDDLPGLPPDRQVEFRIDLVPGVTPVARALTG
ncbi:hypothetical protein L6452_01454 [Arctium lappa]|uniref:Uncharacterized protein n=1 Tax=Arctium lappa TaxID=4217 RepID=A0ACB9FHK5_ARCLA|nr:hypothetical protein L6452_01454 [Arctium lappa]